MRSPYLQLYIHLVWSTLERAPLIPYEVQKRLYDAICKRCTDLKCTPLAIGGVEDHIHLLVQLHPSVALADLVKDIKGATSHLMNHEICPGMNFRWQGAYGAFSIRANEVSKVRSYILAQTQHHANGVLMSEFEVSETHS